MVLPPNLPVERDATTNCLLWQGPRARDGRLLWYFRGEQRLVARDAFAATYGALSVASRLRRLCGSPTCISPYHHVVQNPLRLAEIVECSMEEVRAIASLIRSRQRRDPEEGINWDVEHPLELGLREDRMRVWAARLDEAPLLIVGAFATLVRQAERDARSGRTIPVHPAEP